MAGCCFGGSKKQPFTLAGPHMANVLSFEDPTEPLTVGTIDDFISDYIERSRKQRWTMCMTNRLCVRCASRVRWRF